MIHKREGAKFDGNQIEVMARIEPFTTGLNIEATRGHSTPQEQLETIEKYARQNKCLFPEFMPSAPVDIKKNIPGVGLVFHWQRIWSKLLSIGIVVNPPEPAICLEDYTRPSGEQMKGKIIEASTHIFGENNGMYPIDFSQKVNGIPNIGLVERIMVKAKAAGAGISFVKVEVNNGCVHIGTEKVIA